MRTGRSFATPYSPVFIASKITGSVLDSLRPVIGERSGFYTLDFGSPFVIDPLPRVSIKRWGVLLKCGDFVSDFGPAVSFVLFWCNDRRDPRGTPQGVRAANRLPGTETVQTVWAAWHDVRRLAGPL